MEWKENKKGVLIFIVIVLILAWIIIYLSCLEINKNKSIKFENQKISFD